MAFSLRNRIAVGVAIFACLAIVDLYRNGRAARRWREYLFLIAAVAVAMAYGALNDQFSSAISWEYFYYGKELYKTLGSDTPPERTALQWGAAKVGMQATWSVGLLLGAGFLIANNPRPGKPQLSFLRLFGWFAVVFLITVIGAIIFGYIGWRGGLVWCSNDFRMMVDTGIFRPQHFMAAWGEHLGAYIGGIAGGTFAIVRILALRRA